MEQQLASEAAAEQSAPPATIESWATNPPMRHIPAVAWMIEKLDGDVRRRLDLLLAAIDDDARRAAADSALRTLCRALERVAEVARHGRGMHPPNELAAHVAWSLNHAVSSLRNVDAALVGRRYPFHTGERSKSEPLYGAVLWVLYGLDRLTEVVRGFDPSIDEKLYAPLVRLESPMPAEPLA